MIQEQKASGLSIKNWCMENCVRKQLLLLAAEDPPNACAALEQVQDTSIAEIPLAPKASFSAQVRITMNLGR